MVQWLLYYCIVAVVIWYYGCMDSWHIEEGLWYYGFMVWWLWYYGIAVITVVEVLWYGARIWYYVTGVLVL